jgi:hypothetical protein
MQYEHQLMDHSKKEKKNQELNLIEKGIFTIGAFSIRSLKHSLISNAPPFMIQI